jgi:hypothetical protein
VSCLTCIGNREVAIIVPNDEEILQDLDRAWDDLIHNLNAARVAIQDPANFPPPSGDRNNAEGYRYLLGQLHRLIETEIQQDADFPYIQHHPSLISKYTIENPDCSYLYAPIRPNVQYRLSGKAADVSHWNGPRNPLAMRLAPNYVIFEAHTVAPGDSGSVRENIDGTKATIGKLDSREMQVNPDGTFEILLGPERPQGYTGNLIATTARKGTTVQRGDVLTEDKYAYRLYIRELFADWEKEEPLEDLSIERVGSEGQYPKVRTAEDMAAQLRQLGVLIRNHMKYWTALYARPLDPSLLSPQQKSGSLPINGLFKPRANTTQAGGGQSTNAMTGGIFELQDDQSLVIEFDVAAEPDQIGFQLANYWGESYDYANRVTSLNHLQSFRSSDGVYRYVVSARDPGIQNWMDTAGYDSGFMVVRFTFSSMPTPEQLPKVRIQLVHFGRIKEFLPSDTPAFSRQDRIRQIRMRQRHVSVRYRQY